MNTLNKLLSAGAVAASLTLSASAGGDDPVTFPASLHYPNVESAPVQKALKDLIGKPAPKLAVGDWHEQKSADGKPVDAGKSIEDMKGSIVVIDFWGTWCPPCRRAIPHSAKLSRELADQGVEFIGVSNTRGSEKMGTLADELGMSFPTAADLNDQTAKAYKVQWWPFYVLVDREGIVRTAGLRPDKIEDAVKLLLTEQPYVPAAESPAKSAG